MKWATFTVLVRAIGISVVFAAGEFEQYSERIVGADLVGTAIEVH